MKVAHGILLATLLAFSSSSAAGNVFFPSDNIEMSSEETFWNTAFEAAFKDTEVERNYNSSDDTPTLQCYFSYEMRKLEIYLQVGQGIQGCKSISLEELEAYFKHHSWQRFKRRLIRDVLRCQKRSRNDEQYIDCLTDVVSKSLNDIKHEYGQEKRESKECIRFEFARMVWDLNENSRQLGYCLLNSASPISNTTVNPWYPWQNTTHTPPKHNTTWNPWANSTSNPWQNSTARPPVFNTTSNPWANQTWNPWWNSTHRPTTWYPWERPTQRPPWANSTLKPWNTTWNPWQNVTEVPSTVNTTSNTWYPWWSTTHRPWNNTHRPQHTTRRPWNTTDRPWSTTRRPWNTTDRPWSTTRRHWNTTNRPWSTTRRPWNTTDRPWSTTRRPWNTTDRPRNTTLSPSTWYPWQNTTQTPPVVNATWNPWQNSTQNKTIAPTEKQQWNPFWNPWFSSKDDSFLEQQAEEMTKDIPEPSNDETINKAWWKKMWDKLRPKN